jgi:hypothetical protein
VELFRDHSFVRGKTMFAEQFFQSIAELLHFAGRFARTTVGGKEY